MILVVHEHLACSVYRAMKELSIIYNLAILVVHEHLTGSVYRAMKELSIIYNLAILVVQEHLTGSVYRAMKELSITYKISNESEAWHRYRHIACIKHTSSDSVPLSSIFLLEISEIVWTRTARTRKEHAIYN